MQAVGEWDGTPPGGGLRFGANYVPSQGWFYSWLDFSADDVRRDFADLAGLGLDHVRVFPIWPWIQPNRGLIRERGLADLLAVVDVAAEFDLEIAVDVVQGHLSSFDFMPSWTTTWHERSVFEDRGVRDGLRDYVAAVCRDLAQRPNVFAVTLGNEVNNLYPANTVTPHSARSWASELLEVVRDTAPQLVGIHSLHDEAFYVADHPFLMTDATDLGEMTSVHSWVFTGASALDGPAGPATLSHADYLVELAVAVSRDPHRPVWLQEIGAPRPDIPGAGAGDFTTATLEMVTRNPALWGVTWWCSHDIDRALMDFPDREYDLGLFTVDHEVKPAGRAIADLIVRARSQRALRSTRRALVCPDELRDSTVDRAQYAPGSEFHRRWVQLRDDGPVAIVSRERAGDATYLRSRGVGELISAPDIRTPVS